MNIDHFNKYIIQSTNDTHLVYLLAFKTSSGRISYKDGIINFFNVGEPMEFVEAVMRYQTDFVRKNLAFLEMAIPNRDIYGRIIPGCTVFLSAS